VAETEVNALTIGVLASAHAKMIIQEMLHGSSAVPFHDANFYR
jgi:hypothetical protein